MAPVEHYPFRFRDPRTGKWVRARYVATRSELESRYREWEILGPPDIRGDEPAQMFQPNLREIAETPLELQPSSRDAAANRRDRADPATSFFPAVCHLSGAPAAMETDAGRSQTVRSVLDATTASRRKLARPL